MLKTDFIQFPVGSDLHKLAKNLYRINADGYISETMNNQILLTCGDALLFNSHQYWAVIVRCNFFFNNVRNIKYVWRYMPLLISNCRILDFQFDMDSGRCIAIPLACCSDRGSYNFGICITAELKGWPIDKSELLEKVGNNSLWLDFLWIKLCCF